MKSLWIAAIVAVASLVLAYFGVQDSTSKQGGFLKKASKYIAEQVKSFDSSNAVMERIKQVDSLWMIDSVMGVDNNVHLIRPDTSVGTYKFFSD